MNVSRFYPPNRIDQSFGMCIGPEDLIFPFYNHQGSHYYRPWKWCTEKATKDFGSTIHNEKDKYQIFLDVQHFTPNEINVKVTDKEIIIEGDHEDREDIHGFISRHFKRRYSLPKDCSADSVVSSLSQDGILIVTADRNKVQTKTEIRIPIKLCSGSVSEEATKSQIETVQKSVDSVKKSAGNENTTCTTIMLKEDHCCLLKPELLREAAVSVSEKEMVKDLKENDNILKGKFYTDETLDTNLCKKIHTFRESGESNIAKTKNEKVEKSQEFGIKNVMMENEDYSKLCGVSNAAMTAKVEMNENFRESGEAKLAMAGISKLETSNIKSSETLQVQQSTSSYSSSVSSSIRETTDKISEIVSDISAQLKEAAENI